MFAMASIYFALNDGTTHSNRVCATKRKKNDEFQGAYSNFIFYSLSVDVYARRLSCHDQGQRR